MTAPNSVQLAVGLLSVVPVGDVNHVDRGVAGRAMRWVPLVGAFLGLAAAAVLVAAQRLSLGSLTASVLAVSALAALTGGLHLDGLADTADGLGSRRSAEQALTIMRTADIGPFGVAAIVLVLLLQVSALAQVESWRGLVVAVVVGRLSILVCCRRGVPAARADGLGALVAGTVSPAFLVIVVAVVTAGAAAVLGWAGLVAVVLGLVVTHLLVRHCVRRLGGVTGDVMGAAVELATTTAVVALAAG